MLNFEFLIFDVGCKNNISKPVFDTIFEVLQSKTQKWLNLTLFKPVLILR